MPLPSYTTTQVPTPGVEPWGICHEPVTNTIWSPDFNLGIVYILDATSNAVVNTLTLNNCNSAASDGVNVWVTWDDGAGHRFVAKCDPVAVAVIGSAAVGTGNGGVTTVNGHVWVSNPNNATVTKVDAATIGVLGTFTTGVGTSPLGVCADGLGFVWTVNQQNPGSVSKINETTGALSGPFILGNFTNPHGIIFETATGHIWATTQGTAPDFSPYIQQIDQATGALGVILHIGNPGSNDLNGLAFDGTYLWVADGSGLGGDNLIVAVDPVAVAVVGTFNAFADGAPLEITVAPGPNIWTSNNNFPFLTKLTAGAAAAGIFVGTFTGFAGAGQFMGGVK